MKKIAFGFLLSCCAALGQNHKVTAPTLGFVFASNGAGLQPILGVPGAARLSTAITTDGVAAVAIAPGSQYFVAEKDGGLSVGSITDASVSLSPISGTLAQSPVIVFSPSGSVAAVYSPGLNTIQVISGLPAVPQVTSKFETGSVIDHFAVSDDGQELLAHNANGVLIDLVSKETLSHSDSVNAIAFAPTSHVAYVSGPSAHTLLVVNGDSATMLPLSDPAIPPDVQALVVTADGTSILLGSPSAHSVWAVNSATGKTTAYPVEDGVTNFSLLGVKDTFLMQYAGGTYGVVVWRNGHLNMSFVGTVRNGGVQ